MRARIEIYIRSYPARPGLAERLEASQHRQCEPDRLEQISARDQDPVLAPGTATSRVREAKPLLQDRILAPGSEVLLPLLETAVQQWGQEIRVYDVGQWSGRLKALSSGVWKTPAVIVEGHKDTGCDAVRKALRNLGTGLAPARSTRCSDDN